MFKNGRQLGRCIFAHALPKVRAAYMRTDLLQERFSLMTVWADYLDGYGFPRKLDAVAKELKEANRLKRAEVFKGQSTEGCLIPKARLKRLYPD